MSTAKTTAAEPDAISDLLAQYDDWDADRADLATAEDNGGSVRPDDWQTSDDTAVTLLHALVAAIRAEKPTTAQCKTNYCVTVAGPERHDGEAPYQYVVTADSPEQAAERAQAAFRDDQETDDTVLITVRELGTDAGIHGHWNDLREPV